MSKMMSRERVSTVVKRQIPDRVPHFEWSYSAIAIKTLTKGGTYDDLIELLDIDAVVCSPDYRREVIGDNLLRDEWGVVRSTGLEEYAMPVNNLAPIKSVEDFEKWKPPDPYAHYRFETLQHFIECFKGRRTVIIYVKDVWSHPRDLMGYMELCIACLKRPDLVNAIIERCVEHTIRVAELAAEMGAELVLTADDIADNRTTLISPELWNELFMPHFCKLVNAFHGFGLNYWKHSDGNIMPVMDSFVDAGIDGIDPIDPLGNMDLATVKQQYGDRIAIKGNVDCVDVLVNGPEDAVIEAVKEGIRIAGPSGGYVCSSSNSIHSGVKPELYRVMVEAIHKYGVYPLNMDILEPKPVTKKR
ncbi:MAG: hypothetical protein KAV87_61985 [Desulfobacteraceae bacterium]|nr:hypothetical protein [Desulfobacteraceae bacterium]